MSKGSLAQMSMFGSVLLEVSIELEYCDSCKKNATVITHMEFSESLLSKFPFVLGNTYKYYYMNLEKRNLFVNTSPFGLLLESGLFKEFHFTFKRIEVEPENRLSDLLEKLF